MRLFAEEPLTPSDLAYYLDIEPNYARQIILRLKRQGLIFRHKTIAGDWAYSLTSKGVARITYLADKEKRELESKAKEAIAKKEGKDATDEKRAKEAIQEELRPMFLHEVISHGLPKEVEEQVCREFGIQSVQQLGNKKLGEINLPQEIQKEAGFTELSSERRLGYRQLPLNLWVRVLLNASKAAPKPQHLSFEEVLIVSTLCKQKKGDYLVTKDGEMFYAPGEGYLTIEAASILAGHRKAKSTR